MWQSNLGNPQKNIQFNFINHSIKLFNTKKIHSFKGTVHHFTPSNLELKRIWSSETVGLSL